VRQKVRQKWSPNGAKKETGVCVCWRLLRVSQVVVFSLRVNASLLQKREKIRRENGQKGAGKFAGETRKGFCEAKKV